MSTGWMRPLQAMGGLLRKTGPYLAIELVLPGGTLVALLLFLYQRRSGDGAGRLAKLRQGVVERARRTCAALRGAAAVRAVV